MLRGKELEHPPVIAAFLNARNFPFTLAWPLGEVEYDLVLASMTSADTASWCKALNHAIRSHKEEAAAKVEGWLFKEGGRKHKGTLHAFFSSTKRRWFVLSPPNAKQPRLAYYPSPMINKVAALGAIPLNSTTQVTRRAMIRALGADGLTHARNTRTRNPAHAARANATTNAWQRHAYTRTS